MNIALTKSSRSLFNQIVDQLNQIYNKDESRQLTKMLMEDLLEISFEKIMIDEEIVMTTSIKKLFEEKVDLLLNYHPIQYVLGKAHFYGREFIVNPSVLIPRQETEELIGEILIDTKKPGLKILDIGSGSGCIGITLALELQDAHVSVLDVDGAALDVARQNALKHNVALDYIKEDILSVESLPEKYDIIVSNPPYVTEKEKDQMHNNVLNHEPHLALFVPDDDPLKFYRQIVSLAKKHLTANGKLYFEINESYGPDLLKLCEDEKCSYIKLVQDITGKDRMIKAVFG